MKVLVTGGAGFIGSHLVRRLLSDKHKVSVIDNFATGRRENINSIIPEITLFEADIRNLDSLIHICKVHKFDYIFHLAALPSVARSLKEPAETNSTNITGTLNILIAAKETGVKRVIFSSSSSVYGDNPKLPKKEIMKPSPISFYALTKLTGEKYCKLFTDLYGLETISLRYFNVFGERQDPDSEYSAVIPLFIKSVLEDKQPLIYDDGSQKRDFTYVGNVVQANILAMRSTFKKQRVFNISFGKKRSVNSVLENIYNLLSKKFSAKYTKTRLGDIKNSDADISRARKVLGYKPLVNFEDGLKRTIEYYNDRRNLTFKNKYMKAVRQIDRQGRWRQRR